MHNFAIVWNAFLSLFGVAFVVWLLWYALKRSDDPAKLILKWILTLAVGWFHASTIMDGSDFGCAILSTVGLGFVVIILWRDSLLEMIGGSLASHIGGLK